MQPRADGSRTSLTVRRGAEPTAAPRKHHEAIHDPNTALTRPVKHDLRSHRRRRRRRTYGMQRRGRSTALTRIAQRPAAVEDREHVRIGIVDFDAGGARFITVRAEGPDHSQPAPPDRSWLRAGVRRCDSATRCAIPVSQGCRHAADSEKTMPDRVDMALCGPVRAAGSWLLRMMNSAKASLLGKTRRTSSANECQPVRWLCSLQDPGGDRDRRRQPARPRACAPRSCRRRSWPGVRRWPVRSPGRHRGRRRRYRRCGLPGRRRARSGIRCSVLGPRGHVRDINRVGPPLG